MLFPLLASGRLTTPDGAQIPYIQIGEGPLPVVLILGVNDGLDTVDMLTTTPLLTWLYSSRARSQRLLCLSRRQPIPPGYRVEQHAEDLLWALKQLQWGPTVVEGLSAGGPIAQWMAVKGPDLVRGLILSSCPHYANEHTQALCHSWIGQAQRGEWAALRWSLAYYTFTPNYWLEILDPFAKTFWPCALVGPFLDPIRKPRYPERVERLVAPLLSQDNRSILPTIGCPTLVIGGEEDRVIDASVQREMARLIPNSRLKIYPGYGHGNSFVNPDYPREVERFLREVIAPTR